MNKLSIERIPTFVINLKRRSDRKMHTINEFKDRPEFSLQFVEALECSNGALGLWSTIRHILMDRISGNEEFILIGEDDIEFTDSYNKEGLFENIQRARDHDADLLLGGISWFSEAVRVSDQLFWTDSFTGTHFTVIFKSFFHRLASASFHNSCADLKMVSLSKKIFFVYPFVAIQKDFGYSDATHNNNIEGRVESLFKAVQNRLSLLDAVRKGHERILSDKASDQERPTNYDITLPIHVILSTNDLSSKEKFEQSLIGKTELHPEFVTMLKHPNSAMAYWSTVRCIITELIDDEDDMVIICTDRHRFTDVYDHKRFIDAIITSNDNGADLLFGGAERIFNVVPLTGELSWAGYCFGSEFIVVYRKFFGFILNEINDRIIIEQSYMPFNTPEVCKILMYPPISETERTEETVKAPDGKIDHSHQVNIVKYLHQAVELSAL